MKYLFVISLVALTLALPRLALSHGTNKPGPNGGFIRMPGAFHTELVPENTSAIRIFLLDVDLRNPTTKNSELRAFLRQKNRELLLQCAPVGNAFSCRLPEGVRASTGDKYVVWGNRNGTSGGAAVYEIPLKLGMF